MWVKDELGIALSIACSRTVADVREFFLYHKTPGKTPGTVAAVQGLGEAGRFNLQLLT